MGREVFLEPPEHLDGVDDAHVGVVEVVQRTQGEGRQRPNQTKMANKLVNNINVHCKYIHIKQ